MVNDLKERTRQVKFVPASMKCREDLPYGCDERFEGQSDYSDHGPTMVEIKVKEDVTVHGDLCV